MPRITVVYKNKHFIDKYAMKMMDHLLKIVGENQMYISIMQCYAYPSCSHENR